MKLYTEEQVRDCMSKSFSEGVCFGAAPMYKNESFDEIIKLQSPIELPNDKEIGQGCDDNIPMDEVDMWSERFYFKIGAKWVVDKIKNWKS